MNVADLAIKKSLSGEWDEAVKLNLSIIRDDPQNIEALNRLGKAYTQLGKLIEAQSFYRKVLRLDRYNPIAKKNLERLGSNRPSKLSTTHSNGFGLEFLEEPGKTKLVSLVKLASTDTLSQILPGTPVNLNSRQHSISITTKSGETLGRLPDDLAARLLPMIKSGNLYSAIVRSANATSAKILIKEEKRSKRFANIPSFPSGDHGNTYLSYIPPEITQDETTSEETEEEKVE